MSKRRRRRSRDLSTEIQEQTITNELHSLLTPSYRPEVFASYRPDNPLLDDQRFYHPLDAFETDLRPNLDLSGVPAEVGEIDAPVRRTPLSRKTPQKLYSPVFGFKQPDRVAVCVRRKQRREVLFAKGGMGSRRRHRRNRNSDVRC